MKVMFVNDSTSNPNWGDRAAATALRTMIADAGGTISYNLTEGELASTQLDEGVPGHTQAPPAPHHLRTALKQAVPPGFVSIARKARPQEHLVPRTWDEFLEKADLALGPRQPWPVFIRALADTDVVLIHGDGAITGNGIAPRTMFFIAYIAKEAFAKPVIIVNHTADLNHPELREIAFHAYPLIDDVVFRDPISQLRYGERCAGRYAADATFMFEPAPRDAWMSIAARPNYFDVWPDTADLDPSRPYLCIGGSSILARYPHRDDTLEGYRRLIERIQRGYDGQVVLTVSDLIDQPLFRVLAQELELPLIGLRTPVQQAIDILGNADAYIGGRWHPSIFALLGGTPIVPLSAKTEKMRALAEMVGLTSPPPGAHDLRSAIDPLVRRLQESLDRGPAGRDELREWAEGQALTCYENVAYLQAMTIPHRST